MCLNVGDRQLEKAMISVSTIAAEQALKIMQENEIDAAAAGIKVGVKAGGCSGLNYVLEIVENPGVNDRVFADNGVRVFVDPKSYLYLTGTQLEWEGGMMGGSFKFVNPNAKRSCGCGTSFAV